MHCTALKILCILWTFCSCRLHSAACAVHMSHVPHCTGCICLTFLHSAQCAVRMSHVSHCVMLLCQGMSHLGQAYCHHHRAIFPIFTTMLSHLRTMSTGHYPVCYLWHGIMVRDQIGVNVTHPEHHYNEDGRQSSVCTRLNHKFHWNAKWKWLEIEKWTTTTKLRILEKGDSCRLLLQTSSSSTIAVANHEGWVQTKEIVS